MDTYLFKLINNFSHRFWFLDDFGVFSAQYLGYFLILTAITFILKEKKWQDKIYFFSLVSLSLILSRGIIAEIIKFFSQRQRPFNVLNINPLIEKADIYMSFPSGHAAFYFALAFAVLLFYFKKNQTLKSRAGYWFLGGAILISFARIFVGVHWPSDVLIGAFIGIISSFFVKKVLDREFGKYNIQ